MGVSRRCGCSDKRIFGWIGSEKLMVIVRHFKLVLEPRIRRPPISRLYKSLTRVFRQRRWTDSRQLAATCELHRFQKSKSEGTFAPRQFDEGLVRCNVTGEGVEEDGIIIIRTVYYT